MSETDEHIKELAQSLTTLQRKVVMNLVSGDYSSNRACYYAAGGTSKTDESADSSVSEILSDHKVAKYKNALLDRVAEASIITRTQSMKILSDIAQGTDKDIIPETHSEIATEKKIRMQSIKQLGDMDGWEAPKRTESDDKLTVIIEDKDRDA